MNTYEMDRITDYNRKYSRLLLIPFIIKPTLTVTDTHSLWLLWLPNGGATYSNASRRFYCSFLYRVNCTILYTGLETS